ncbi:hypothetical protein [Blautia sp.]|uniref:hypothetical protein n=1 Tax=Blautia sp. TaxID=1955243 RepID=UPI0035214DB3
MKQGGFLEGTKLTGYPEQKPKKKGKRISEEEAADTVSSSSGNVSRSCGEYRDSTGEYKSGAG